jgi:hypothetical protein
MIQRYTRPLDADRRETKRFTATGLPLTRLLEDSNGPVSVKVYGLAEDFIFEVNTWEEYTVGDIRLRAPEKPRTEADGTQRWELETGTLVVGETSKGDPFLDSFSKDFEATCRCTVLDRHTTWIDQKRAVRIIFQRPMESRMQYGTLWLLPTQDKLVAIQWTASSGDLRGRPLATGRAMVALIQGVTSP